MIPARGFYHLEDREVAGMACRGLACFVARERDPERWRDAERAVAPVSCLGRCDEAPSVATSPIPVPRIEVHAPHGVVLGRAAGGGAAELPAARAAGAYEALAAAAPRDPAEILDAVTSSGLRGRGGAGFPTGRKWSAVAAAASRGGGDAVVIANADEGDAGAYIDRVILERDPHALVEGLALAALAVGAAEGIVYVRKEYPDAAAALSAALEAARSAGIVGDRLLGTDRPFDVRVVRGEGSYVCGEETALLNALEGRRPVVRARPPYPAESGLWGRPTLVNNVETLASVPWIVANGGPAYASMGTSGSPGTKAVSLNSLFERPGVYEVEFGTPVRTIVGDLGGGLRDGDLRGVIVGGPLAGVLPPALLDTPFTFEDLRAVGCDVGHGGIVAFDGATSIPQLVAEVFRFGAFESCGECTPCRVGTARIADMFRERDRRPPVEGPGFTDIVDLLAATSLCGHGTGLAAFARSVVDHYRDEVEPWLG